MAHLLASPCCYPAWTLEEAFSVYAELGLNRFEWFTEWTSSALDVSSEADRYLALAGQYGMSYVSGHLPKIQTGDSSSYARAISGARMAAAIDSPIIIFGADTLDAYVETLPRFLEDIASLGLTVLLENHRGASLATLDDYQYVLQRVPDPRVGVVLEVGHFHYVGISWREALDALSDRVGLVHAKDIADGQCVPFGQGEVGLDELVRTLQADGYEGDYVLEIEGPLRQHEDTLIQHLQEGVEYFRELGIR